MGLSDDFRTRFAIVDVETSGLSPQRDGLLQVGVVVTDGAGTVVDRWESLVRPRRRWWYRVGPTHIHGITRRSLRGAPSSSEVLERLRLSLQGAIFVAHNAEFDVAFLRKAAQQSGIDLGVDATLCTLRLSRQLDPGRTMSHRLGSLCEHYGIELIRPHDALADADATAALLPYLLTAHGIDSLEAVRDQLRSV